MPERPSEEHTTRGGAGGEDTLAGAVRAEVGLGRIGPYHVLEQIGEGGFGVVYLAERRSPMVQRVAVKVIKPGMDSRAVVARFEQERQSLAVMDHPAVARVYDGGLTGPEWSGGAGRPYFVMEYVKGEPITEYCDKHTMSVRDRLSLFVQVCEAVQHAHTKGIIHRDIKPANVLVGVAADKPVVKVIDFGVAKAIASRTAEATIYTERGVLVGTPEYMSPEQAEMGATDVDTRTDVYSLGVLLYELLTGALPFDSRTLRAAAYDEIRRMIREVDPPRPSTKLTTLEAADGAEIARRRQTEREQLSRELRQELEWIPLRAMRKDRTERYRTPADLADDVGRYLRGEALVAGPESAAYRVRKFVRRNRGPVLAAAVVLLTLLGGVAGTTWQYLNAKETAKKALRASKDAVEAAIEALDAKVAADKATLAALEAKAEALKAKEAAEFEAYAANLAAADASLSAGEWSRMRLRLAACPERFRNWEWRYLSARAEPSLLTIRGFSEGAESIRWSPSGDRVVTASHDGTSRVWEAATGRELVVFRGHTKQCKCAAFDPAGGRVVSGGVDNTARIWDASTGAESIVMRGHTSGVLGVAFDPTGRRVVTSSWDQTARVWDVASGKELAVLSGHTGPIWSAEFSPSGDRIVTASTDRTARVWDAATGLEALALKGHERDLRYAAFNDAGDRIVTGAWDKTARVWEASTGKELLVVRAPGEVFACGFNPSGDRIVTGEDRALRVWEVATGKEIAVLTGHVSHVNSAAFSPSGDTIASASADGTVRFWDALADRESEVFGKPSSSVRSTRFDPAGDRVVSAIGSDARVWDPLTGAELLVPRDHRGAVRDVAFSPDGTRIATVCWDKLVRVFDASSGRRIAAGRDHKGEIECVAFNTAGDRLVTGSTDNTARVWDVATGAALVVISGHDKPVRAAAFNPKGDRIVTGSDDNTARVWDAQTGEAIHTLRGHRHWVASVCFDPTGTTILTTSMDNSARLWDAATGRQIRVLLGHEGWVLSGAFSPSGDRVLTASADTTARLWEPNSGKELLALRGHSKPLNHAAFSASGDRIVTSSQDGTARVWDSVGRAGRYAAIVRARAAAREMAPVVAARLAEEPDVNAALGWLAERREFDAVQRRAGLAIIAIAAERRAERAKELEKGNGDRWAIAKNPASSREALEAALAQAQEFVALNPVNVTVNRTIGTALYRLGMYEEAVAAMKKAEAGFAEGRIRSSPACWAVIAMSHHRLGRSAEAAEAMAKLRALMGESFNEKNEDSRAFLAEAVSVVEGAANP